MNGNHITKEEITDQLSVIANELLRMTERINNLADESIIGKSNAEVLREFSKGINVIEKGLRGTNAHIIFGASPIKEKSSNRTIK